MLFFVVILDVVVALCANLDDTSSSGEISDFKVAQSSDFERKELEVGFNLKAGFSH